MMVKPLGKMILIAENSVDQTTDSGIILEGTTSNRDSKTGTVLAVGPGVTTVAVNDKVYLEWNKGHVVKIDDAQRVMIAEEFIVAVVGA